MPQNRQYYRKVKYPDKVAKPKCRVFVRIFLFCSVGIKIQYFPTVPIYKKPINLYYKFAIFLSYIFFIKYISKNAHPSSASGMEYHTASSPNIFEST